MPPSRPEAVTGRQAPGCALIVVHGLDVRPELTHASLEHVGAEHANESIPIRLTDRPHACVIASVVLSEALPDEQTHDLVVARLRGHFRPTGSFIGDEIASERRA